MPVLGHDDIILDPHAAELAKVIDLAPVDVLRVRVFLQLAEQRLDEVEARLDREDETRLDVARQAQVRMPFGFRDVSSGFVGVKSRGSSRS